MINLYKEIILKIFFYCFFNLSKLIKKTSQYLYVNINAQPQLLILKLTTWFLKILYKYYLLA